MKNISKKTITVLIAVMLFSTLISPTADASMPRLYSFDSWEGAGSASVRIDSPPERLIQLTNNGNAIDSKNYTVTKTDTGMQITLNEDYLKTLKFKSTSYLFSAVIANTDAAPLEISASLNPDSNNLKFTLGSSAQETFVKLACGGKEVDSANYTVVTAISHCTDSSSKEYIVTLKDEYAATLSGTEQFVGFFSHDRFMVVLQLKDIRGDLDGDEKITAFDARECLRASVNLITLTEQQNKSADVLKEGKITAAGARKILRVSTGLEKF